MESSFMLFGDSKSISQQPKRTKILFPLFVVWLKSRLLKNHMFLGPSGPSHPIHWIIWHRYLVNINRKKSTWWRQTFGHWGALLSTGHYRKKDKTVEKVFARERECGLVLVWREEHLSAGWIFNGFLTTTRETFWVVLTFIFKSTQQQHLHWFVVSPQIAEGRSRDPQQWSFIYFSWCDSYFPLARYIVSSWRWLILSAAGSSRLLSSG